ncbi:MAG: hypothetical protein OQL06_08370 [Gammaproteobacteria bacterium]|nr:hypothetical protein [Gammaproteobacteria bacterium]
MGTKTERILCNSLAIKGVMVMTIHFRNDSDGNVHQIWAQRQMSSCAIASIWMARNQARQMTVDESEWGLAWRIYHQVVQNIPLSPPPSAPMTFAPSSRPEDNNQTTMGNMFANAGTYMNQVAQALTNDGLRVTHNTGWSIGRTVDPARLSDTTPAIILLGWYPTVVARPNRAGGHFIVASRQASSGNIVYLDPWGGVLSEINTGPVYQVTGRFEHIIYISA